MKLLLDARFWRKETGGISRYSQQLLNELLKLGTDDQFHVLIRDLDEDQFTIKDRRVTKHVTSISHYSVAEQLKLPGFIRTIKPDLVHFLNFNQPIRSIGCPRVTTIHDLTVKFFPVGRQQSNPLRRLAFDLVMRRAAQSERVIAISRATKIDIVRHLAPDPERVTIIYESADERFTPRSDKELAAFRTRAGLTKPYILFVNQWRPHKGLPELIEAFGILKSRHKLPHQLVITGKPNDHFPNIPAAITASKYRQEIELPGFVADEDLPLYTAAASVLAFPSYYEGFGLPVLEAMRSGTPVVCTGVSSLPEVAGEAAEFVSPKDPKSLAQGLANVLTDPKRAEELSKLGLAQAAQFSWAKMAQETYGVYEDVLGGRKTENG